MLFPPHVTHGWHIRGIEILYFHHFPLEISWKDWRHYGEKSATGGIDRVWGSKTWGGVGGKESQSPWGLSFSSRSPSLSSPLLVWTHDHSSSVSVHIMTIFRREQQSRDAERKGYEADVRVKPRSNTTWMFVRSSRADFASTVVNYSVYSWNLLRHRGTITRILTLSTQSCEPPQVPSWQSLYRACHRCLRSHRFSGGEIAAAAVGCESVFTREQLRDRGP